jgi:hypothetical protein
LGSEEDLTQFIAGIDATIDWLEKELRSNPAAKARGKCRSCGGIIQIAKDGDLLWIHDGGQGIDTSDPYILLIIDRIRERHPEWSLSSMCRKCNEEIIFLTPHNCSGMSKIMG